MKNAFLTHGARVAQHPLFRVALSALFLWLAFRKADLGAIVGQISAISPWVFIGVLALYCTLYVLGGVRWAYLLAGQPSPKLLKRVISAALMGNFYSLFLPTVIGGDLVKWLHLRDQGFTEKQLMASVVADRLAGFISIIMFGLVGGIVGYLWLDFNLPMGAWLALAGLAVILAGFSLLFFRLVRISQWWRRKKIIALETYLETHQGSFMRAVGLSLGIQSLAYIGAWALIKELGLAVTFPTLVTVQAMVNILVSLPVSFSGLGATEAAYLYFFSQLGLASTGVLAFTTLLQALRFGVGAVSWVGGTVIQKQPKVSS